MISHVELIWGDPALSRFLRQLGAFARVVIYDKLGTGLSDPIAYPPSIEDRAREAEAVLNAAEIDKAAVVGLFDGGATAAYLAATRPDRVTSLVLLGTHPVGAAVPDAPHWEEGDWVQRFEHIRRLTEGWGDGRTLSFFGGTEVNPVERQFWATFERASASPGMVRAMVRELGERDIRGLLEHVPQRSLVLHTATDHVHPFEQARLIADHLPDARLVALAGPSRWPWVGDPETVLVEIREHLTGLRAPPPAPTTLKTILFTDVVGSTELASTIGDARWRDRFEQLERMTTEHIANHGGQYVKSTGDGALATFDGPARAIRCAHDVVGRAPQFGLELRAGVHSGEVEEQDVDVRGIAVHVAARICDRAGPREILISEAARKLIAGSTLQLVDRGRQHLKGVNEPLRIFAATAASTSEASIDRPGSLMRLRDRAAVSMTRRAPAMTRLMSRLSSS